MLNLLCPVICGRNIALNNPAETVHANLYNLEPLKAARIAVEQTYESFAPFWLMAGTAFVEPAAIAPIQVSSTDEVFHFAKASCRWNNLHHAAESMTPLTREQCSGSICS